MGNWVKALAFVTSFIAIGMFTGCNNYVDEISTGIHDTLDIKAKIYKGLTYKVVNGKALRLDAYLPIKSHFTKIPSVIFIHGGTWTDGSRALIMKNYRENILDKLLKEGYAVFSISYRLADTLNTHLPAPIEDCKDAVRWIRKNATHFGLNPAKIGLWGASAGAHLALMAAYTPDSLFTGDISLKNYSAKVSYVVDNFGPTNLNQLLKPDLSDISLFILKLYSREKYDKRYFILSAIAGIDPDTNKEQTSRICGLYSPIYYVNANTPPTLIIHGRDDSLVELENSLVLDDLLSEKDIPHKTLYIKDTGHGFRGVNAQQMRLIVNTTIDFVKKH